jgi:hypothetical protein
MQTLIVRCLVVCIIGGCTTLHPIANVPSNLSEHFSDGGALRPGDRVIISTVAGAQHHLQIRSVRDGVIYGDHDSVSFSEIDSIERREFSATKTTLLVVVIVGDVGGIASAVGSASHPNTQSLM